MPKLERRQLITYAVVGQNLENSNDFLAGLMPFYDPIVAELSGKLFDVQEFSEKLRSYYDWPVNEDVAEELIPRLVDAGRLETIKENGEKSAYFYSSNNLSEFDEAELSASENLKQLGELFSAFSENLSPLSAVGRTLEGFENILLNWIVAVEGYDKDALSAAVARQMQQKSDINLAEETIEDESIFVSPNLNREESYLCARFVEWLSENQPDAFLRLIDIASVALLTEVVLSVRNPPDSNRTEPGLTIFFDTPMLMDALGLSGRNLERRMSLMISQLRKMKIKIWTFEHTCKEVRRNLRRMFELTPHERYGYTAEAIKRAEVLEDFARTVMGDVESSVEEILEIQIVRQSLSDFPNSHSWFSEELYFEFVDRATWHDYAEPKHTDALSVAMIMRKRGGQKSRDALKCKFLMTSRNWVFCEFAHRFCKEHGLIAEQQVGPIIQHRQLAALLLMTLGYQGKREFIRSQVLGTCERVMRTRPRVIKTALRRIKECKPELENQLKALLTQPRSTQVLRDKTLNSDHVITNDTIGDLIELMNATVGEEERARADAKIKESKNESLKVEKELNQKLVEQEKELSEHKTNLENAKVRDLHMLKTWVGDAAAWERKLTKITKIILAFIAVSAAIVEIFAGTITWLAVIIATIFAIIPHLPFLQRFPEQIIRKLANQKINARIRGAMREDLNDIYEYDLKTETVRERNAVKSNLFD